MQEPSKDGFDISWKAENMYLNRFCIDEEAGFEVSGVYRLNEVTFFTVNEGLTVISNKKIIESAFQKNAEFRVTNLEPHFIYAGGYGLYIHLFFDLDRKRDYHNQLKSFFGELMKKYQVKSVMLTFIYMKKNRLIINEMVKSYCKGEKSLHRISINDDLEILFEDLQQGNRSSSSNHTYFLPRLTEDEMELVQIKDPNYFKTFYDVKYGGSSNPDVRKHEMKMSNSETTQNIVLRTNRMTKPKFR